MSDQPDEDENSPPTVIRAPDYKVLYSNLVRTRVGNGEFIIVFSQFTHAPGLNVSGNIIEERGEVTLAWPQFKILAAQLNSLVQAIEAEVGIIPIPDSFIEAVTTQLDRQRAAVRSLGLVAQRLAINAPSEQGEEPPQPRPGRRRKS